MPLRRGSHTWARRRKGERGEQEDTLSEERMQTNLRGAGKRPPAECSFLGLPFLPEKTSRTPGLEAAKPARAASLSSPLLSSGPPHKQGRGPAKPPGPKQLGGKTGAISVGEEKGPTWLVLQPRWALPEPDASSSMKDEGRPKERKSHQWCATSGARLAGSQSQQGGWDTGLGGRGASQAGHRASPPPPGPSRPRDRGKDLMASPGSPFTLEKHNFNPAR